MLARLKEAYKLGFRDVVLPAAGDLDASGLKLGLLRVAHVRELAEELGL
jgi:predicted ATP-dependent serine protease